MKWMLTCEQVVSKTSDFVDGGGSIGDRLRIRMHLAMCRLCREYVRQLKLTVEALGRLRARLPDHTTRERLLQMFRGN